MSAREESCSVPNNCLTRANTRSHDAEDGENAKIICAALAHAGNDGPFERQNVVSTVGQFDTRTGRKLPPRFS